MFWGIRLACVLLIAMSIPCRAGDTPGVTATQIKIGGIFPLSGAASSIGQVGQGVRAVIHKRDVGVLGMLADLVEPARELVRDRVGVRPDFL